MKLLNYICEILRCFVNRETNGRERSIYIGRDPKLELFTAHE